MKKHFNFQLMPFIVLFSMIMVLTSCKKSEEPLPSVSLPTATTSTAKWISQTWAILNGTVNANNQITAVTFEYDTTTSYGQSINATPDTISGNISTVVSANLTGLTTST